MKNGELKKLFNIFVKSKEWERIKGIILDKMDSTFCWLVDTEGHYCFKKKNDKDFCRMIKSSLDGTKRCEKFLMFTLSQARKNKMPTCAMCDAGFLGFACPILVGQEVIGTIGGCQIANSDLTYSSYGDIARKFNLDPDKFMTIIHKEDHLMPTEVLEIEAELITLLAQSAIELVFKQEQLLEREEEIKGISESYQLFSGSRESILNLGKENLYSLIVNMVARAMGAEICSLMLLDEETQELTMKAAVGLDILIVSKAKVKVGQGIVGYVINTGKPLLVEDIEQDTRFTRTFRSNRYYTKSLLTSPLKINDKVIGVISVNNKATHGPFNQRDLELFTQICKHIGLAIENLKPYPSEEEKEKELRASEVGRLRTEAEQLELLCNIKREEIKELEQQVVEMNKPYPDQLLKEYEEQKAVIEELNKKIVEQASSLSSKIKDAESEIERLNVEINQRPQVEEIKEIKAQLEAETVKAKGYEAEVERLKAIVAQAGSLSLPEIAEIEEKLHAQTIIAEEVKIQAEELKIKLEEEFAKTQLQTQELERLTAELETTKGMISQADEYKERLEAEKLKVTALTEQIEEFTTQVGELELLKSQIKELREKVGTKEEIGVEPTDFKVYAETLKTKLEAETAKAKALTIELNELKGQLRDTRLKNQLEELERLKKERATLQQLQAQTALIKDLRIEAEKAKERVKTEHTELDELKAQQAKLGLLYQVKQEIKDALRQQTEAKNANDEKAQAEAEERLKELRAQNEELEKLRAQSRELNFLFRMSQELAQMFEREKILELVLDEAHTYLDYYAGAYLLIKDDRLIGTLRRNCKLDEQMIENLKARMLTQWLEWNPRRKKEAKRQIHFEITGEEKKPIPKEEECGDGFISAPIRETGKTIGILSAYSFKRDGWTPLQKRLLTIIADQVSVALERSRLFEEMKESAERDELTKVYNFRYFEKFFDKEYELAVRYNQPLSMIMLDFDHLKHFNDTYGHEAGNRLIKAVAQSIQRNVRKSDWVTRFGGDEFAIIMPQTNEEGALLVGEKVRQAIAEREMVFGGHTYRLTASLGVSTCYKENKSFNAKMLIARADEALYWAKEEGRNRVCLYHPRIKQEPIKPKYQWKDVFLALMRPLS